jgi:hypothetical protein
MRSHEGEDGDAGKQDAENRQQRHAVPTQERRQVMIAFLLLCVIGSKLGTSEHVDMIELNHYFDNRGQHVFDQVIFWRIEESTRRYQVQAWRMCNSPEDYPTRNANGQASIRLGFDSSALKVRSKQFRESWTQVDPERMDLIRHPGERLALEVK